MLHNRTHEVSRHPCNVLSPRHVPWSSISPKLVLYVYKSISLHEGTCRRNISPGHVLTTISCVCKCDFAPATCPRYSSLLMSFQCVLHKFLSLQRDPSCLPTLILLFCPSRILRKHCFQFLLGLNANCRQCLCKILKHARNSKDKRLWVRIFIIQGGFCGGIAIGAIGTFGNVFCGWKKRASSW